jgi:hypothetical protein
MSAKISADTDVSPLQATDSVPVIRASDNKRVLGSGILSYILNAANTWIGTQSFADGTLFLNGSVSGSTVLHAPASTSVAITFPAANDTLAGIAAAQTLTNKTISASSNTISNLATTNFGANVIDNDGTLAANSSTRLPTQAAVKAYAVTGPGSSVSGNVATFSGTSGRTVQDSGKSLPSGTIVGTSDSQTLTNKTISSCAFSGTATGNMTWSGNFSIPSGNLFINGPSSGSTNIIAPNGTFGITLPAATDTLVGLAATQTLTNKTLTSPTINGGTFTGGTDIAVADGGTGASTAAGARANLLTRSGIIRSATGLIIDSFSTVSRRTRTFLIDDLYNALNDYGIWAKLDALWIMAAADSQAACVNWKNPGVTFTLTPVNSPTFTADRGFAGDGATSYLDTGLNLSTLSGGQATLNAHHFSVWCRTAAAGANTSDMGNAADLLRMRSSTDRALARVGDGTLTDFAANTDTTGHFVAVRRDASTKALYARGSQLGSDASVAATSFTNANMLIGQASGAGFTTKQFAAASIGGVLDGTEIGNFNTALQAYMTGVGA